MEIPTPYDHSPQSENENRLLLHINNGMILIQNGEYGKAVEYFTNNTVASNYSIHVENGVAISISPKGTYDQSVIHGVIEHQALTSHFDPPKIEVPGMIPIIVIGGVILFRPDDSRLQEVNQTNWQYIQKNSALVAAEEWFHAYQYFRNPDQFVIDVSNESEKEVARYFHKKGINMTDEFLNRYDRSSVLNE